MGKLMGAGIAETTVAAVIDKACVDYHGSGCNRNQLVAFLVFALLNRHRHILKNGFAQYAPVVADELKVYFQAVYQLHDCFHSNGRRCDKQGTVVL